MYWYVDPVKKTFLVYTDLGGEGISAMNLWAQWNATEVLYIWQLVWKKILIFLRSRFYGCYEVKLTKIIFP